MGWGGGVRTREKAVTPQPLPNSLSMAYQHSTLGTGESSTGTTFTPGRPIYIAPHSASWNHWHRQGLVRASHFTSVICLFVCSVVCLFVFAIFCHFLDGSLLVCFSVLYDTVCYPQVRIKSRSTTTMIAFWISTSILMRNLMQFPLAMICVECFAVGIAKVFLGIFYHREQMVTLAEFGSDSFLWTVFFFFFSFRHFLFIIFHPGSSWPLTTQPLQLSNNSQALLHSRCIA